MQTDMSNADLVRITADIITAHVTNNATAASAVAPLVSNVHAALAAALGGQVQTDTVPDWEGDERREGDRRALAPPVEIDAAPPPLAVPEVLVPMVPISEFVTPDVLTCLECGKQLKTMRLHLKRHHGLSADDYRARWGLPRDYPMTAAKTNKARSDWAKAAGLGQKGRDTMQARAAARLAAREGKPGQPRPRLSVAKAQAATG